MHTSADAVLGHGERDAARGVAAGAQVPWPTSATVGVLGPAGQGPPDPPVAWSRNEVPLAEGGQLVFFAAADPLTAKTSFTDVARLPVELLPELGRGMGVFGPDAVAIRVSEQDGDA